MNRSLVVMVALFAPLFHAALPLGCASVDTSPDLSARPGEELYVLVAVEHQTHERTTITVTADSENRRVHVVYEKPRSGGGCVSICVPGLMPREVFEDYSRPLTVDEWTALQTAIREAGWWQGRVPAHEEVSLHGWDANFYARRADGKVIRFQAKNPSLEDRDAKPIRLLLALES